MFYFLVVSFLMISVQCISYDGMGVVDNNTEGDVPESEDIKNGIGLSKYGFKHASLNDYSDFPIGNGQEKSDLFNTQWDPDFETFLYQIKSNKDIPEGTRTVDIQNILNEIESNGNLPIETVTSDIQSILNEMESNRNLPIETATSDIQIILNEMESNRNLPIETVTSDIQIILNEIESNRNLPIETATIDIQSIQNKIEFYRNIPPIEVATIDIQNILDGIKSNRDIPIETITFVWSDSINGDYSSDYSSIYAARRILSIIGVIIFLIFACNVTYKRIKARKNLKLRVFVISNKPEKSEPLLSV